MLKQWQIDAWKSVDGWNNVWNSKTFMPFEEARTFARSLGLKNEKEWRSYCKVSKPQNIPTAPESTYKDKGWVSLADWLGTEWLLFEEARRFVHALGLKNKTEWRKFCKSGKKPNNIPSGVSRTYKSKGWNGWGDWLGTNNVATFSREYLTFEEARVFARSLGLKNQCEWQKFCASGSKPDNIPSNVGTAYKSKGWKGWGDWLGTGNISTIGRNILPFNEARTFARSLKISSFKNWKIYHKSGKAPDNIPRCPHWTYRNSGWVGYRDWLGNA